MISELRLVRRCSERHSQIEVNKIPYGIRGFYVLLEEVPQSGKRKPKYDVVYIGIAQGHEGIRSRVRRHKNSTSKGAKWTHFSFYEVWPNITTAEVLELEGLFRHIYRGDTRANRLAKQKGFKKLKKSGVLFRKLKNWPKDQA